MRAAAEQKVGYIRCYAQVAENNVFMDCVVNTVSQTHCANSNPKHCVDHSDSNHINAAKTVR